MNGNSLQPVKLEKTGKSCEGADFSWLSSKVSQTLLWTRLIWGLSS